MSTEQQLNKTLTDPRFERGMTLLKEKRLEEAVVAFADLLRTMCETEQLGDSLSVAPVYYHEDAEQDAREAADDLEAAWEMLELARVIYARYPGDLAVEAQFVRVYTRLGDLGLESDQFEQARADFEKALLLRRKLLKASKAEDTTQLADLYCSLAIASIYRDSTTEGEKKQDQDEDSANKDEEGLTYYVLAGRVMAENIHRSVSKCAKPLQEFVEKRIPKHLSEQDSEAPASKGKGKRKATEATNSSRSLLFTGAKPEAMKEEFTACAKGERKEETLTKDEEQLLEYLEIYLELKEKVDGIKETDAGAVPEQSKTEESVTTIGFGQTDAEASATPTVNVIPVVKKRKTEASESTENK
ncbi:hypothetical protein BBO99_00007908 [Phytophthora kernoviae]|uniref:Tetratricopeptide SHNi-TPR domain-containing protein n=2 Tax=Phytophthora kernoviae TaxID=325452 RepID=A0A3R7K7Y8_9STRA|nr:hypothetical protein G195_005492 [Phytophthora kernoviae 00238/432]KAG2517139.1 hypothetical protein JM16_007523 [Phytophthora kernoviae]KAG2519646.1 hypothetical protein JM18_007481 [Phytophthora kernoviae]RLN31920.1 hypothetical protein BBI17_007869 [Phytophthora kernoviae]RLN75979.1 hypothetical protein BBO99_00007908 [Phytophthora kernoviae]